MEISRNAATAKGPAETFTGEVWIDPITRGLPPRSRFRRRVGYLAELGHALERELRLRPGAFHIDDYDCAP